MLSTCRIISRLAFLQRVNEWDGNGNIGVTHPQGGSSSTVSSSNWNLEILVFEERGKPELEYPEKKPLGARTRGNNKLSPRTLFFVLRKFVLIPNDIVGRFHRFFRVLVARENQAMSLYTVGYNILRTIKRQWGRCGVVARALEEESSIYTGGE